MIRFLKSIILLSLLNTVTCAYAAPETAQSEAAANAKSQTNEKTTFLSLITKRGSSSREGISAAASYLFSTVSSLAETSPLNAKMTERILSCRFTKSSGILGTTSISEPGTCTRPIQKVELSVASKQGSASKMRLFIDIAPNAVSLDLVRKVWGEPKEVRKLTGMNSWSYKLDSVDLDIYTKDNKTVSNVLLEDSVFHQLSSSSAQQARIRKILGRWKTSLGTERTEGPFELEFKELTNNDEYQIVGICNDGLTKMYLKLVEDGFSGRVAGSADQTEGYVKIYVDNSGKSLRGACLDALTKNRQAFTATLMAE